LILENKEYPYKFDASVCSQCEGNCCIGESGYIWINSSEIENLANHLNLEVDQLVEKYLTKVGYKYTINEQKLSETNYACIFFDLKKKQCLIYEARPTQCRTFPFWDYFKNRVNEVKDECPAIID
jgi:Fe-S-cluster containining protein